MGHKFEIGTADRVRQDDPKESFEVIPYFSDVLSIIYTVS